MFRQVREKLPLFWSAIGFAACVRLTPVRGESPLLPGFDGAGAQPQGLRHGGGQSLPDRVEVVLCGPLEEGAGRCVEHGAPIQHGENGLETLGRNVG